jgi:PAS domain S-box-containing protein
MEKRNPIVAKPQKMRNTPPAPAKVIASVRRAPGKIGSATEKMKTMTNGARRPNGKRPAAAKSMRRRSFRYPKTELEQAIQRYVGLFDFAPIGYVTFDRSGRIEEVNIAAARLAGRSRRQLIGSTFAVCVAKQDVQRFLNHLFECHSSDGRVVTELHLRRPDGKRFPVQLSSTATLTLMKDGAHLYQTAIVDLTERERADATRSEAVRQQGALYELSQRHQEVKTLHEIYDAALDAILTALRCDRAAILLYDQQQVMRFVAWRGLSQKYRKLVEGHSPWKPDVENPQPIGITDVDVADIPKPLKSTIQREGICAAAFIPLVSSGRLIGKFMTYYDAPHRFTDDELKLATTIARQLVQAIQHKHDADALRESEARMRATVEQATAGVVRYDTHGRFAFVNRTFCQMLGYTESELIGKSIEDVTHRDDLKENMRSFRRMIQEGKPFEIEKRYIRKDGSVLWADVSASPVRALDGKIQSSVAVIVDITDRKKAEAALQKEKALLEQHVRERTGELRVANKELQAEIERRKGLEGQILEISDREQQRLGQELHDGLCQHLTAVAFMARSVGLRLKNHRVIDVKDIEKIAELVNAAAADTRNLSRALHRMDVDAAGFVTAVEDLADREIWKTPCRLEVKPSFRVDDDATAAQLYRIAREAVINANKHAQAREIVVKLERSSKGMVLRVVDDGVGSPEEPKLRQGLGFHIMKYRAQLLGGRLEIDSPEKGGMRVSCYLPNHAPHSQKSDGKGNDKRWRLPAKITKALTALI